MNLRQNRLRMYLPSRVRMAEWNLHRKHQDQHLRATEVMMVIYLDPRRIKVCNQQHRAASSEPYILMV